MANQTITANTNFDTLTGLLAGETVTVNSGAELLINSDPQVNRVMAGSITVNDGSVKIDGTTVRELNFSSASSLPAIGDTLTAGSVTGQVIGVTGTTTAGTVRLRSLNGAIANGASLSFTGGKTATATSDDRVGWLFVLFSESSILSLPRLGSLIAQGDWYYLGTSNGAASQTFTFYCTAFLSGLWVETGANTNQWTQYANLRDLAFTTVGNGERGNFFRQQLGSATITFGNGTNGNIPPNGARIRVCNVTIASGLTTAPTSPTLNQAFATNQAKTDTSSGGSIYCNNVNLSSFFVAATSATELQITDSTGFVIRPSNIPNTVILNNLILGNGSSATIVQNLLVSFCACNLTSVYSIRRGSPGLSGAGAISIEDSVVVAAQSVRVILLGRQRVDDLCFTALRCVNLSFNDCDFLGSYPSFSSCQNIETKNCAFGDRSVGNTTSSAITPGLFLGGSTSAFKLDGMKTVSTSPPYGELIGISSANNIAIRNIGSINSPYDGQNLCGGLASLSAMDSIKFERCYLANIRSSRSITLASTARSVVLTNVSFDYSASIETDAQNCRFRGVAGGNGVLGASGINIDQSAANGTHFGDFFFSATTGGLVILGNEKTTASPSSNSYQITAGSPKFNGTGRVLLRAVGDRIEWTWPWFVLGHTGFQNTAFTFSGTNQSNHLFQYQIDTGSGFGAWKTLNAANLSAEAISFTTGFRLKVAAECTVANANNAIAGILIPTTTTATAQQTLYPVDIIQATLSFTGLIAGTEVRIFRTSDGVELAGIEDSDTSFSYTYDYLGVDVAAYAVFINPGYGYQRIPLTLGATSNSIPIQQRVDYSYG